MHGQPRDGTYLGRAWLRASCLTASISDCFCSLDTRDWLPEGHLALFVDDPVEQLDRNAIYGVYQSADDRGRRGCHPAMIVKLLVYGYCVGKPSSRKIERATYEEVAFRVLSGDQHPDHDCISASGT